MKVFLMGLLDIKSPTGKYNNTKRYRFGQRLRKVFGKDIR